MRILHASNFADRAKGAFQHAVEFKLSNGMIRNGHAVVNFSDRAAARAAAWLGHRMFGIRAATTAFVDVALAMRPDLIVFGHADSVDAAALPKIRAALPSVKMLQYSVDRIEPGNVAKLSAKLPYVDATLVSTAGDALKAFRRPGARVGFLPNPVDVSIESARVDLIDAPPFDLIFPVGAENRPRFTMGRDWSGREVLEAIARRLPALTMRTPGARGEPTLIGGAYQDALASAALGLNVSWRNDEFLYSSDRLAHFVGNGLVALVDRATAYEALFKEGEFVYFSDIDELTGKIAALTADPARRRAIAAAGRLRYAALFNERIIAKYVVDAAFGTVDRAALPWPSLHDF